MRHVVASVLRIKSGCGVANDLGLRFCSDVSMRTCQESAEVLETCRVIREEEELCLDVSAQHTVARYRDDFLHVSCARNRRIPQCVACLYALAKKKKVSFFKPSCLGWSTRSGVSQIGRLLSWPTRRMICVVGGCHALTWSSSHSPGATVFL